MDNREKLFGESESDFIKYYKKACRLNELDACLELGESYENGLNGVLRDYKLAVKFYHRACELNSSIACNNLGYLYDYGIGTDRDNIEAFKNYKRSCRLKSMVGCYNLALKYFDGDGVKRELFKAYNLFSRICEKGLGEGCNKLGIYVCTWLYIGSHGGGYFPKAIISYYGWIALGPIWGYTHSRDWLGQTLRETQILIGIRKGP